MRHNKDVIVPNVWRPLPDWLGGEQPYDLNSWQESETALQLARELHEDAVIVEGYQEYATWRPHLAYLRDPYGDPLEEMDLDGVGGVSILSKARVFRSGTLFPAFSYERHAETEVILSHYQANFRDSGNGPDEWDLKSLDCLTM
jgi:mannan polymerase II complex ANP1 subunit